MQQQHFLDPAMTAPGSTLSSLAMTPLGKEADNIVTRLDLKNGKAANVLAAPVEAS
jgi:hypothetical protein